MIKACPYCWQIMIYTPPQLQYKQYWTCGKCNVNAEFLENGTKIVRIHCTVKDREYTVRLDEERNQTSFTRWELTADGFGIGDTILSFPGILESINPGNVVEKIKFYLVFS